MDQYSQRTLLWPTSSGWPASLPSSATCSFPLGHCSSGLLLVLPSLITFAHAVSFVLPGLATAFDLASSLIPQTGEVSLSHVSTALVALAEVGVAQYLYNS